jgi:5-methylcytosine-specific restriction endonuclease McrA
MANSDEPLPQPDSPELAAILPRTDHQQLYAYLFDRRDAPPSMREIRTYMLDLLGEAPSQTDRRVRELYDQFKVSKIRRGKDTLYRLDGWADNQKENPRTSFNRRTRAQVLAPQRCAQCGRTPLDHNVVLVVDHKIPREWGGSDSIENLQPLCEECNSGKKDFYATYDKYAEEIRAASSLLEPHARIGELLKAFRGDWVPSELIGVVASMQTYQEDWQKRTRELRHLDWVIKFKRRKDPRTGRHITWYRAAHWEPWPDGPIRAEIERRKRNGDSSVVD